MAIFCFQSHFSPKYIEMKVTTILLHSWRNVKMGKAVKRFFEFKAYLDHFISFATLIMKLGRVAVYKRLDYGGTERGEDVFSAAGQLH